MTDKWSADNLVSRQSPNGGKFSQNFLQKAVCEFRFPTLLDLGSGKPPASFARALRKDYPILEAANEFTFSIGNAAAESSHSHIFRSSNGKWTVALKDNSVAIESLAYPGFPAFRARLVSIIAAASEFIDSEFFTRVGLRYINEISPPDDPIRGWINPSLVAPLLEGVVSGVNEYSGRLQLRAEDGGCLLQHGIVVAERKDESLKVSYKIDIDCYRNETKVSDAIAAVDRLHTQGFNLFDWALGEASRSHLSKSARS